MPEKFERKNDGIINILIFYILGANIVLVFNHCYIIYFRHTSLFSVNKTIGYEEFNFRELK